MSNRIVSNSTFAVNNSLEQVVEVGNTSLAVTNAGLTALAGAIAGTEVQVDIVGQTGTLNVSDSTAQTSLGTIAGAVSGSEMQVDIVSSSGTISVSDSTAQTSLATIATETTSIDNKLPTIGQNAKSASVSVTLASDQGAISVSSSNANNSGTSGNLVNAASKSSGDFSDEVDTRAARNITISGVTTDGASNKIEIYTAHSSSGTKFKLGFDIYPDASGNFYEDIHNVALNYIYLKFTNSSAATITATALSN